VENAYYKLGNYGTGTLWYLSNRGGAFVHFNRLQIAKLEPDGGLSRPAGRSPRRKPASCASNMATAAQ
jgi:hypothetical protein